MSPRALDTGATSSATYTEAEGATALDAPANFWRLYAGSATTLQGEPLSSELSTSAGDDFRAIEEGIFSLLEATAPEELEDGADAPLIPNLFRLLRTHGTGAVLELAGLIESGTVDPQIASWIVRWLGRIPHHESRHARRWLLERALRSSIPFVRDGAALGLASLRDPRTIPALRAAAEREQYRQLRVGIEKALRQVERAL